MVKAVALDPFLVTGIDLEKSDDTVIAALKPGANGRCSDQFPPEGKSKDSATSASRRRVFYQTVANHVIFMNNALDYVGKNGEIVLSRAWSGDQNSRPPEPSVTQSNLIGDLDKFADRLIKILNSYKLSGVGDAFSCLSSEDPRITFQSADILQTLGNYFEMKGRNFGAAVAPRSTDYTDSGSGPLQRAEERIKSLCYALNMYEDAIEKSNQPTPETGGKAIIQSPAGSDAEATFASSLSYYNDFEF